MRISDWSSDVCSSDLHILVDEAQDTNMRQWGIILSLAEEFFAAVPEDAERDRTLFTVGDRKQAIYGFQGTDPRAFATARDLFHVLGERAQPAFRRVDLELGRASGRERVCPYVWISV